jgi:hypothetical protein
MTEDVVLWVIMYVEFGQGTEELTSSGSSFRRSFSSMRIVAVSAGVKAVQFDDVSSSSIMFL